MNIIKAFILGNPRSGTSLFRIMLNNHGSIVAPPESGFAHWWLKKYHDWSINDVQSGRLDEFLMDLVSSKKFETWELSNQQLRSAIIEAMPKNYEDLITCIYLAYSPGLEMPQAIIDKNNYYINHIEDLSRIWQKAKYIHLIRDGRDVACSYIDLKSLNTSSKYKPVLPVDIESIAEEWVANNNKIALLSQSSKDNYIAIRYEDLVLAPERELTKICAFLGLDYDPAMVEYYNSKSGKSNEPQATIDWKKKTLEAPDSSRIKRYQRILTNEQINQFNTIASDVLSRYNYEVD